MSRYRPALPQLSRQLFLTDGGLETSLIYHHGQTLPHFAAFTLLETLKGRQELTRYYERYLELAATFNTGLVLETPTWRASTDWGQRLGHTPGTLADLNRSAVAFIAALRNRPGLEESPVVLSGNIGPRGDGYDPGVRMRVTQAADYHAEQIMTFAATEIDMVSAFTINYVDEGIGIAHAARVVELPVVISFTVETNGDLPSGESLQTAIERTDDLTDGHPAYYMINCAHPSHFLHRLAAGAPWLERIQGIRANASRLSHAELDQSISLDAGDPAALAADYLTLRTRLPALNILGGCCGTDHRHVAAMAAAVTRLGRAA